MKTLQLFCALSFSIMSQVAAIDHLRAPQPKSDNESVNAFRDALVILD